MGELRVGGLPIYGQLSPHYQFNLFKFPPTNQPTIDVLSLPCISLKSKRAALRFMNFLLNDMILKKCRLGFIEISHKQFKTSCSETFLKF